MSDASRPLRVGIVNDVGLARETLRRLIEQLDGTEVAWLAEDGKQAVERCASDRPDLVLMDLLMPIMNGVEATREIMRVAPCPILVVTATVDGNFAKVYDAMGAGALDAVDTPTVAPDGSLEGGDLIRAKIRMVRRLAGHPAAPPPLPEPSAARDAAPAASDVAGVPARASASLVAVASSTGGPDAILHLLRGLPPNFEAPIVVVQHLGQDFLDGFVAWLAEQTSRRVSAVERGMQPAPGHVLVAAGEDHLILRPGGALGFTREPKEYPYRPSADVFFASLARHAPRPGVAVVLTGMGRDGAQGIVALHQAGWSTLAQDKATSVVYGMPRAAAESGAVDRSVAIGRMGMAVAEAWERLVAAGGRTAGPS